MNPKSISLEQLTVPFPVWNDHDPLITYSRYHYSREFTKEIPPCEDFLKRTNPKFVVKRRLWGNLLRDWSWEDVEYYYSPGVFPCKALARYLRDAPKYQDQRGYHCCVLKLQCEGNPYFDDVTINLIWKEDLQIKLQIRELVERLRDGESDDHIALGLPIGFFDYRVMSSVGISKRYWIKILERILVVPLDYRRRDLTLVSVGSEICGSAGVVVGVKRAGGNTRQWLRTVSSCVLYDALYV